MADHEEIVLETVDEPIDNESLLRARQRELEGVVQEINAKLDKLNQAKWTALGGIQEIKTVIRRYETGQTHS